MTQHAAHVRNQSVGCGGRYELLACARTPLLPRGLSVYRGMDEGVAELFRNHQRDIYAFVRRRTNSPQDAEDIVQSVFASAVTHLDDARQQSPTVLAWLYTAARHRLIDEARRRAANEPPLPLHDAGELAAQVPTYGIDVAHALARAIKSLPNSQQRIVVMRLIQGRSFAEIAEATKSSEAACKMRLTRGLEAIRSNLSKEGLEP
jgi:RNA polymerase sigma-70 factor (ECF subfamily)